MKSMEILWDMNKSNFLSLWVMFAHCPKLYGDYVATKYNGYYFALKRAAGFYCLLTNHVWIVVLPKFLVIIHILALSKKLDALGTWNKKLGVT